MRDSINDRKLIALLKKSPERGIKQAMDLYGGAVKTICSSKLMDCCPEDIEEAVADSFVGLWKSADKFDFVHNVSVKSYLYGIARHVALDKRKWMKQTTSLLEFEENELGFDVDMESEYTKKQNEKIIRETLEAMGNPDKEIFILRYFFFEKVNDIASRLNLERKFVENRLFRGKAKLKEELVERGIIL